MTKHHSFHLLPIVTLFAFGCAPTETELFSDTQFLLGEGTGESCERLKTGPSEINIDDHSECGEFLSCVTVGEQVAADKGIEPVDGMCTCRCDGPEDQGPYCSCGDGFQCVHLIEDLGLTFGDASYCLPQ